MRVAGLENNIKTFSTSMMHNVHPYIIVGGGGGGGS